MLDALEQAVHDRRPVKWPGLVHHSHRGSQYLSIRYTERLGEAGIEPSVGSVGESYDNARAEMINGLFRTEVIHRRAPWLNFEAVEHATLEWVDWFDNRRLLEPIENIPPSAAEANCYAALGTEDMAAVVLLRKAWLEFRLGLQRHAVRPVQAYAHPLPPPERVVLQCTAAWAADGLVQSRYDPARGAFGKAWSSADLLGRRVSGVPDDQGSLRPGRH